LTLAGIATKSTKTQKKEINPLCALCAFVAIPEFPVCAAAFAVAKLSFTNIHANKGRHMDIEATANAESQATRPRREKVKPNSGPNSRPQPPGAATTRARYQKRFPTTP
jgi:hypothetical protein